MDKEMQETINYEEDAYDKGKKVASDLTKALNTMTYEKEVTRGFVDEIIQSHRTIQQSTMRAIYSLIMRWADSNYDARNQSTVEFCQKIKKMIEDENIHFPFI